MSERPLNPNTRGVVLYFAGVVVAVMLAIVVRGLVYSLAERYLWTH